MPHAAWPVRVLLSATLVLHCDHVLYLDEFQSLVTSSTSIMLFDGSHLDFPGMNRTIQLHPHQAAAVWRGMSAGNTLLAQAVGAGKTFTNCQCLV